MDKIKSKKNKNNLANTNRADTNKFDLEINKGESKKTTEESIQWYNNIISNLKLLLYKMLIEADETNSINDLYNYHEYIINLENNYHDLITEIIKKQEPKIKSKKNKNNLANTNRADTNKFDLEINKGESKKTTEESIQWNNNIISNLKLLLYKMLIEADETNSINDLYNYHEYIINLENNYHDLITEIIKKQEPKKTNNLRKK